MLPIRTILHPTDFSEHSAFAFQVACALARDYGARVVVAHAIALQMYGSLETGPLIADPLVVEAELRERLETVRPPDPSVAVERRLCKGDAAAEIVALAADINADLIVMGTHGRKGVGRLLLGSVAESVLRRAPCPVVTVRAPFPAQATPKEASREVVPS
jgi:nucleotide-binding universal stress UspA family protein